MVTQNLKCSLLRRVLFLKQNFKVDCTPSRLRLFYKQNNVTFRVQGKTWKVKDADLPLLDEERKQYAVTLRQVKD